MNNTVTAKTFTSHPPNVTEVQTSMCHIFQPQQPQPIARWILEEGQVLGVLVSSFSSLSRSQWMTCGE